MLLVGEFINANIHRGQLQAGDLLVDVCRDIVDPVFELVLPVCEVNGSQYLVGKAHIHHRRWMTFGCSKIDQASLGEQADATSVCQCVLINRCTRTFRIADTSLQALRD